MVFDANLILLDGTIDLSDSTHTAPTSTTRDAATGAAVIDIRETSYVGLAAVLICQDAANGSTDTLTAFIEVSDAEAFGSDVHEMGKFDLAAATKGVILGSEVPNIFVVRFHTKKQYVRLNVTVGTSPDTFDTVKCFLTPYAGVDDYQ